MIPFIAHRRYEQGATALIIVMFSVLLLVILSVGFMRLMTSEQARAQDSELSQGAYDSALAGVEDGKRVLALCANNPTSNACTAIQSATCNTVQNAGLVSAPDGEVYLKSSTSDMTGEAYQQAYTCVKVLRNTSDVVAALQDGQSKVVPLTSEGDIDKIELSWFAKDDAGAAGAVSYGNAPLGAALPALADWRSANEAPRPPILRVQAIQLSDLDNKSGAVFLYPSANIGLSNVDIAAFNARRVENTPKLVSCKTSVIVAPYACTLSITIADAANKPDYLRIMPIYAGTKVRLALFKGELPVKFVDIQPTIDSTGRAADVYRRVNARVERGDPLDSNLYPRATIDATGTLCKAMSVGGEVADYDISGCN